MTRFFPFLLWKRPTAMSLKSNAWAGLSVALVLIPQAIAYATLAGMPPETGLYAALLPSVIGVLWGSSPLLAVGPVALTSLLVFGSLSHLAAPDSAEWVTLAIWLSLYAGLIQFVLGILRLGKIAHLVSQPVVIGFVNAAALLIVFSQVPALVGIERSSGDLSRAIELLHAPLNPLAAMFGATALLLLWGFRHFAPRLPGMLIVGGLAILASRLLGYADAGGPVVGPVPLNMPPLLLPPTIPFGSHQQLWPAALVLALVSFTEAMSSCRVLARARKTPWSENQELVGQGMAKIASGLNGAFPVSGSFSRSALNLYAGATSGWATLFTAACILFSLFFLGGVLSYLPKSVLAAMIMVPVFGLFDFSAMRRLLLISKDDALVAAVSFAVTLISAPRLHWGIFAGVGLSMVALLYRRTRPRIVEVSTHEDGTMRDRQRFGLPPIGSGILAVRIDSDLNFLTAPMLERFVTVHARPSGEIKAVLLCAGSINDIDASGVEMLEALNSTLSAEGITLYISGMKRQVREVLDSSGTTGTWGHDRIFATDRAAVTVFQAPRA